MRAHSKRVETTVESGNHFRWGLYFYLCRDSPRYRAIAEQEWAALESLVLPPSTFVAVQQDSHDGIRRWFAAAGHVPYEPERLGKGNQGCVDVAKSFLNWAGARASSTRSVLILAGTGVLDPWSIVGAEDDPTRTFAICDDLSANDALEISELKSLFHDRKTRTRRPFDVLVCDMSSMQWLEVAYQFDELVDFVVAAQSPVTPGQCPIDELVSAFATGFDTENVERGARHAAEALSKGYRKRIGSRVRNRAVATVPTTVSVLNMSSLQPVSRAFDTFSHALMLALGEEIVWTTREEVAKRARANPFATAATNADWTSEFFQDYAYDLAGLMTHSAEAFAEAQQGAASYAVAKYLKQLDERTLFEELGSIDERINGVIADAPHNIKCSAPGAAYREFFERWGELIRRGRKSRTDIGSILESLGVLPTAARRGDDRFWTEWVSESGALISPRLRRVIEVANEGSRHAKRLETLAARVLRMLEDRPERACSSPLVVAKYPPDSPACGIAVYRPRKLDTLLNANYLQLEFNRRSHWTALLAVINLVQDHARAMWRVIESVLSTAPLDAREAMLQRVFGPSTVVAGFREQLKALASPPTAALSISDGGRADSDDDDDGRYIVRYLPCEPLASIEEKRTSITPKELQARVSALEELFDRKTLKTWHLEQLRRFGRTLGEDVIQNLATNLEHDRASAGENVLHLQLQMPRELMRYPWELMQDRSGFLADRYAVGRQVYMGEGLVRARPRMRHNRLRPLIIAAPKTSGSEETLHASLLEGEAIAAKFESLKDELGDVIDFDLKQDAWIGDKITVEQVRNLLGTGAYDIVHFSGHGAFSESKPQENGWILSDGVLSVEQIRSTLSWTDHAPWLVYANACDSAKEPAVYQGDVYGLASAFITNGVSAYIGALWNVADLAGYLMAVEFYDALCLGRATLGQALWKSRQKVRALSPATTIKGKPDDVQVDALLALTSYSFALYGDTTAKALEQIGTEITERKRG